jgi:hypothetical protein
VVKRTRCSKKTNREISANVRWAHIALHWLGYGGTGSGKWHNDSLFATPFHLLRPATRWVFPQTTKTLFMQGNARLGTISPRSQNTYIEHILHYCWRRHRRNCNSIKRPFWIRDS